MTPDPSLFLAVAQIAGKEAHQRVDRQAWVRGEPSGFVPVCAAPLSVARHYGSQDVSIPMGMFWDGNGLCLSTKLLKCD